MLEYLYKIADARLTFLGLLAFTFGFSTLYKEFNTTSSHVWP
jgi:hypothetical protein